MKRIEFDVYDFVAAFAFDAKDGFVYNFED